MGKGFAGGRKWTMRQALILDLDFEMCLWYLTTFGWILLRCSGKTTRWIICATVYERRIIKLALEEILIGSVAVRLNLGQLAESPRPLSEEELKELGLMLLRGEWARRSKGGD